VKSAAYVSGSERRESFEIHCTLLLVVCNCPMELKSHIKTAGYRILIFSISDAFLTFQFSSQSTSQKQETFTSRNSLKETYPHSELMSEKTFYRIKEPILIIHAIVYNGLIITGERMKQSMFWLYIISYK
jgi:hypothetical protein